MKDFLFKTKMLLQKIFRGYSNVEVWNLDHTFVAWILPRLKYHRLHSVALLPGLNENETKLVMDKMIVGFEIYKNIENRELEIWVASLDKKGAIKLDTHNKKIDEMNRIINEAFELFGKYGKHLGW